MALGDSDIAIFFSDFADTVTFGAQTAQGNVDGAAKDGVFDKISVSDAEYRVTLPAAVFASMPKPKDVLAITTGRFAGSYVVRSVDPLDDGALVEIKLRQQ